MERGFDAMTEQHKPVLLINPDEPEGSVAHILCAKAFHLISEVDAIDMTDNTRGFERDVAAAAKRADVTYDDILDICARYVHIKFFK